MANERARFVASLAAVALGLVWLFSVPPRYFGLAVFVPTLIMLSAFLLLRGPSPRHLPRAKSLLVGALFAALLYCVFFAGNIVVAYVQPLGISASSETAIYSLFAPTPTPVLVVVLLMDAIGFESYFRGTVQRRLAGRFGVWAIFIAAGTDALIHAASLNPLFVATTFVADSFWGLDYHLTKSLPSSMLSHFLWDLLVFIVLPLS